MIILRHSAEDFFKEAHKIEESTPGEWRYFKFSSVDLVLGLYETKNIGLKLHPEFFKYFLGQFTPLVESHYDILKLEDFTDFCKKLNELLTKKKKILDLSVDGLWIWTVDEKKLELPSKLKNYLS